MTDRSASPDTDDSGLSELDYEECIRLLGSRLVGRIALVADNLIVVVPVNYRLVRDGGKTWIAFRTQPGSVLDRNAEHAAFEIDDGNALTRTGWSVLARGMLHRVDPTAADFRERFDPLPWPRSARERWMVLEPFSITGRRIPISA